MAQRVRHVLVVATLFLLSGACGDPHPFYVRDPVLTGDHSLVIHVGDVAGEPIIDVRATLRTAPTPEAQPSQDIQAIELGHGRYEFQLSGNLNWSDAHVQVVDRWGVGKDQWIPIHVRTSPASELPAVQDRDHPPPYQTVSARTGTVIEGDELITGIEGDLRSRARCVFEHPLHTRYIVKCLLDDPDPTDQFDIGTILEVIVSLGDERAPSVAVRIRTESDDPICSFNVPVDPWWRYVTGTSVVQHTVGEKESILLIEYKFIGRQDRRGVMRLVGSL